MDVRTRRHADGSVPEGPTSPTRGPGQVPGQAAEQVHAPAATDERAQARPHTTKPPSHTSPSARRWWALMAIILAILAVTLDVTVLTLALPTLSGAFHASEAQLQWFVTAYTLALVAGMLPMGLVGDRYGRRAVMAAALALFAAGSLGCAYAPNPAAFIAARVVLGFAGAALTVIALALITVLFSEAERPRAVGVWSAANFLGLPLGPVLGGWLLAHAWWGWIFLMNIPVALLALAAVLALVPESRAPSAPAIDGAGLLLSGAGLVALMYGVIEAGKQGWSSADALVPVVGGMVLLVAFAALERRIARRPAGQPLIDLRLFASRSFTWGVILTALGLIGLFGAFFVLPQYLQAVRGMGPQGAGYRLLPSIAGMMAGAIPADRLAARFGAKLSIAAGYAVLIVGSALGATMTATSGDAFVAAWTFVAGAGCGLAFATAASAALVEMPAERSGVASGLLQAVVKLGPAFGASALGSVLGAGYQSHVALFGLPPAAAAAARASVFGGLAVARHTGSAALLASVRTAFVAGVDGALRASAAIAAVALVLALVFMPSQRRA